MLSVARLKNFCKETKFLSDKMSEKSRFRELSTDKYKNAGKCYTGSDNLKKATNCGLKLFNGTHLGSFLTNLKKL